jgi:5-methylcytosine-specific restriction endonuclease McrA
MHYRRWLNEGDAGEASKRTPGAGVHGYPSNTELVALMTRLGNFNDVSREIGVRRESLRDYLNVRPALKAEMYARQTPRLTPDQAIENDRRAKREHARRYRAENPDEARRYRREHMNSYGPEYRHKWNHYNRMRRLAVAPPDELSNDYALILRGDPCSYCGRPTEHVDHIKPIASGGTGSWDNLTAACASCNGSKGPRELLDFMLLRLPA